MILKKRFWYFFTLLAFLGLAIPTSYAQQNTDLTRIQVDEMSDAEVEELLNRAASAGLSIEEFLELAELRGMPASEIAKLKARIGNLDLGEPGMKRLAETSKRDPRKQADFDLIAAGIY